MTRYHFGDRVRIITPDGLVADDRGEIVGININSFNQRYRVSLWHGGITMSYAEHELAPELVDDNQQPAPVASEPLAAFVYA